MSKIFRIATRKSALALWQTEFVISQLRRMHPDLQIEMLPLSTRGDEILDRSLAAIGGKGLFLKELELAMLDGEADAAVHSLKDVPMNLDPPFCLGAVLERADPTDAFVSTRFRSLDQLPTGARVGTSSLRRRALLKAIRKDLLIEDLRGNVNTRLAKLDKGEYDAIILASAGLLRLGLGDRIRERLLPPLFLPAVAQGAIAVECRIDDTQTQELFAGLNHQETRLCVSAERAMNRRLEGNCQVPIAGYAQIENNRLHLKAMVAAVDSDEILRAEASGPSEQAKDIGLRVAQKLLDAGAARLLSL